MKNKNIVCFAKDWSEDPTSCNHVLMELSKENKVLWLNSISTRSPNLSSGRDLGKIFKKLGGELAIKTVNVGFAAFFEEIGRVGLVEDNKGKTQVNISGTVMRETLGKGEMPDARVMRPSTAKVLAAYYQAQAKVSG